MLLNDNLQNGAINTSVITRFHHTDVVAIVEAVPFLILEFIISALIRYFFIIKRRLQNIAKKRFLRRVTLS